MIAVCVPNDIFLSYGIVILTSVFRVTCFSLTLCTDHTRPQEQQDAPSDTSTVNPGEFLSVIEGPSVYVSLLGTEPFRPPATLSHPSGLPNFPRMSVGAPNTKNEFILTPDTLRYFGSTVETFIAQIREVLLAHHATEIRANLQRSEARRQQEKCAEMLKTMEELKCSRYADANLRVQKIMESHKALITRLDRTLQLLMQQASPALSESETKWFGELRRMEAEVLGAGRYDEASLAARISLVKYMPPRISLHSHIFQLS